MNYEIDRTTKSASVAVVSASDNSLLGCPFCGADAAVLWKDEDDTDGNWLATCSIHEGGCGASIGYFADSKEEAAKTWNTRHSNDTDHRERAGER